MGSCRRWDGATLRVGDGASSCQGAHEGGRGFRAIGVGPPNSSFRGLHLQASYASTSAGHGAAARTYPRIVTLDTGAEPKLVIHPAAAQLIREKGGTLYISVDGAGMEHVHFHPPHWRSDAMTWNELDADGIRVFVDPGIASPDKWLVILHHIPYRHVQALWNGEMLTTGRSGGIFLSEKV